MHGALREDVGITGLESRAWNHGSTDRFHESSSSSTYDSTYGGTHDLFVCDNYAPNYGTGYCVNRYYWNKLRSPTYQTTDYMAPIGEYYPFASVLLCKRV